MLISGQKKTWLIVEIELCFPESWPHFEKRRVKHQKYLRYCKYLVLNIVFNLNKGFIFNKIVRFYRKI
jgi:hypothetical protein